LNHLKTNLPNLTNFVKDFQKNNQLKCRNNRLNWFDSKINQFQALSKPVSKTLSVKQPIEMIKQLVVFPLLCKTLFCKKDLI